MSRKEQNIFSSFSSPFRIQQFLDDMGYSAEESYRCPLSVLRDGQAHCFDGALFAAAALRCLGDPPQILYMIADNDDDHAIALYRRDRCWGAVAKSNYSGLRFREPVYRTLRELVLSYFEDFFNINGQKSLRSYTVPLSLKSFDKFNWMSSSDHLGKIADRLDEIRTVPLLTRRMIQRLSPVDQRSYRSGLMGAKRSGLYKPEP